MGQRFPGPPLHYRPVLPADHSPDYLFARAAYVYFSHLMAFDINYTTPECYIEPRKTAGGPLASATSGGVRFAFEGGFGHLEFRRIHLRVVLREHVSPFHFR